MDRHRSVSRERGSTGRGLAPKYLLLVVGVPIAMGVVVMAVVTWWGGNQVAAILGINPHQALLGQPSGGVFSILLLLMIGLGMLVGWLLGHGVVLLALRLAGYDRRHAHEIVFRGKHPDRWTQ